MKKAQINKVFVYIVSIIIILFVAFLVIRFIIAFQSDSAAIGEKKLYEQLETDYNEVYRTLSSEKVEEYRVTSSIKTVCFIQTVACVDTLDLSEDLKTNLKTIGEAQDNVALIDNKDLILSSENIGEFNTEGGCFCTNPSNNRFQLIMENRRNEVWIEQR